MADDDTEDCLLATEAFAETGARAAFSCVEDGEELMDYLSVNSHPESKGLRLSSCLILICLERTGAKPCSK